jgi:hypothetical protein
MLIHAKLGQWATGAPTQYKLSKGLYQSHDLLLADRSALAVLHAVT